MSETGQSGHSPAKVKPRATFPRLSSRV